MTEGYKTKNLGIGEREQVRRAIWMFGKDGHVHQYPHVWIGEGEMKSSGVVVRRAVGVA